MFKLNNKQIMGFTRFVLIREETSSLSSHTNKWNHLSQPSCPTQPKNTGWLVGSWWLVSSDIRSDTGPHWPSLALTGPETGDLVGVGTPGLAWLGRNVNTVNVGPQLLGVPFQARTVHVSGECITVNTSRTSYYCYYVDVDTNYRTT